MNLRTTYHNSWNANDITVVAVNIAGDPLFKRMLRDFKGFKMV